MKQRKTGLLKRFFPCFITWFILTGFLVHIDEKYSLSEKTDLFSFVGIFLPIICAILVLAVILRKPLTRGEKQPWHQKGGIDQPYIKATPFRAKPKDKKVYAQDLIDEAKSLTIEINNSATVFDFVYSYTEFQKVVQELVRLNEQDGIYMYPPPRRELGRAKENIGASINDFISRALGKIWSSGEQWADDVDFLLDEIEENSDLSRLLTHENKARISELRKRAEDERSRPNLSSLDISTTVAQPVTSIDFDQIIKEENDWRRQQRGLSPIEYELEQIDSMEGHRFEYWCADLLRKIGFIDVEVTQGSGDQGVDIIAKKDGIKYAIQCKCYSSDLGNKPVQEVNTGKAIYHCQIGAVITNRYFTQGGKEAAEATGVLLWDRDWIQKKLSESDT